MNALQLQIDLSTIDFVEQFDELTVEEAHAYRRSHNPQTHERFDMRDRLGERLFAETFGFSKSNFEDLMTLVAPSMESFETRGNPLPLYSKVQAALLVLKGNSFLSIAGNIFFLSNNLKTDLPSFRNLNIHVA